jgi:hypothetical protein|tara:strand:- start:1635 stop:2057 length:423 start_codon:yes stop_codon:yes gene_type:complete
MQSIFLSFSIAVLFFGSSVGADVYSHFCPKEGTTSFSYIINTIDHCEDKSETVDKCCEREKEDKDDCCDDEIKHFQLELDYSEEVPSYLFAINIDLPLSLDYSSYLVANKVKQEGVLNYSNPPPSLSGLELCIQNQVFII